MKKSILTLCIILVISLCFSSCKKNASNGDSASVNIETAEEEGKNTKEESTVEENTEEESTAETNAEGKTEAETDNETMPVDEETEIVLEEGEKGVLN